MVRQREASGIESQASETQQAIAKRSISQDLLELFNEREEKRKTLQRRRSVARTIGTLLGVPFPSIIEGVVGRLGQAYRLPGGLRFFSPDGETFVDEEGSTFFASEDHQFILLEEPPRFPVILEMNVDAPGGPQAVRQRLLELLTGEAGPEGPAAALRSADILMVEQDGSPTFVDFADLLLKERETVALGKSQLTDRYLFASLRRETIERLVRLKAQAPDGKPCSLIYKAWPDKPIKAFVYESAKTIKADAACIAFSARGEGIVWAVADTGVDATHPHFATHDTLKLPHGLFHLDFTEADVAFDADMPTALQDPSGHGTHVAGIIAGECAASAGDGNGTLPRDLIVRRQIYRSDKVIEDIEEKVPRISGVAPLCKLMSLRVLNDERQGTVSNLLAAIGQLLRYNDYGYRMRVHGLNLSVGYEFIAEWFATGKSPLCNEVDRLVRIGMVVVVAAGNGGFGRVMLDTGEHAQAAHGGSIADPGNAELAITVGSTHRDMPHAYGVSYFSSKGPTADGRAKPDVLAPGERIVSCAANAGGNSNDAVYREDSGTSMAAPHVSGAVAAFLSIRREFIGRPDAVKELFLTTATDLKRLPHYQGHGLVDLMRAIQAV